jgi:hypothetical protein
MSKDRRTASRKDIDFIQVNDLTSVSDYSVIAKSGIIINASSNGFLMEISREDLVPEKLRNNLSLEAAVGQQVVLYLPQMNLDLDGTITRALHKGKGRYRVAIEFSHEVPEYWRDCLIELLPQPGEIDLEDLEDLDDTP